MIHDFGFAGCIRNAVRAGARMAFLAVAVVAVLSQSCADRHTPMESLVRLVPDDAVVVRTVNLSRLMTEAGCPTPVSGGKLLLTAMPWWRSLPPEMRWTFQEWSIIRQPTDEI